MKKILSILILGSFFFGCNDKEKAPTPTEPNIVLNFSYTFKPTNTFNSEPKFIGGKKITDYYDSSKDGLLIYFKQPVLQYLNGKWVADYQNERFMSLPYEMDSVRYTYDISQGAFFLYALKKSLGTNYEGFTNYKYAFGSADTTLYFKAVIIKGQAGMAQTF